MAATAMLADALASAVTVLMPSNETLVRLDVGYCAVAMTDGTAQQAISERTPGPEGRELVSAVKKGVPVEYAVFPDEGHGFQGRTNRVTAQNAYLAVLDKYVRR